MWLPPDCPIVSPVTPGQKPRSIDPMICRIISAARFPSICLGLVVAFLLEPPSAVAQPEPSTFVRPTPAAVAADLARTNPHQGHPRILLNAADFARVRTERDSDPHLKVWCATIQGRADSILAAAPVKYGLSSYSGVLPQARRLLAYAQVLGLSYRLTSDRRYAERLWQEIDTVCDRKKFPDWGHTHYNDAVEMGTAFAIAYDWLFDFWTDEQRALMRRHMNEFVLQHVVQNLRDTSMPENGKTLTNIRLVYAGGAAVTALASL